MSVFEKMLARWNPEPSDRRWLYVPYDQLSGDIGPLSVEPAGELGIVLVESDWKMRLRPYHKRKLALVIANMRHFALEQARRGVTVRYVKTKATHRRAVEELLPDIGRMRVMIPAEREMRVELQPVVESGGLELIPHEGWLTTTDQFVRAKNKPPWKMDSFYRLVRKESGVLIEDGKPVGGVYSLDAENRLPWQGEPPVPRPPVFPADTVKEEVAREVEQRFADHPGELGLETLPASQEDIETLWEWVKRECLPWFGPYEDAMSSESTQLFHTRLSGLVNLHRITPKRVLEETLAMDIPLASKEGFVRQVIGWREYVRHVHESTDGFREMRSGALVIADATGDGGYERWSGRPWPLSSADIDMDGGASPSALGCRDPLPAAWWTAKSGFACLDRVVEDVWRDGWSHHITRLMVLANIATILDVSPRELTDWFWIAYEDAYDWVVEPNVLGMGTYAVGDLITTKPYVAGAPYIDRMSDFCSACAFNPKKNCPITNLYWAFLARHEDVLKDNPRLNTQMGTLRKRSEEKLAHDRHVYAVVRDALMAGESVDPVVIS